MSNFIPYGRQHIEPQDIAAVVETLESDYLTQGPKVPAFEQKLAKLCQATYGCAFSSATAALHIACLALELGCGDRLWTSPITFVASSNSALYCGATVDFVDVEVDTGLLCPLALEEKLKTAEQQGTLPKIVTVVHLAGQSCDMAKIGPLCRRYGVLVIEDASHAVGADYQDKPVGSCQYSDIAIFSFHPVKIITTAEGGMALTNRAELAEKMALLRSHGITRDRAQFQSPDHGPWYYEQLDLGFNYRMTELQAALGLVQCDRLSTFVDTRNALAARYDNAFGELPVSPLRQLAGNRSAYHLYVILCDDKQVNRLALFNHLREHNIGVNVHYIPVHIQPFYRQMGFSDEDFPQAMAYYRRALSLPLYADLTHQQQDYVVSCIKTFCD